MKNALLNIEFTPLAVPSSRHRRRRTPLAQGDTSINGRKDRIDKRNRTLVARYYYWTEIRRRRFDDVMKILSDYEFFVDDRTIQNALVAHDELYRGLLAEGCTARMLAKEYPGFKWT